MDTTPQRPASPQQPPQRTSSSSLFFFLFITFFLLTSQSSSSLDLIELKYREFLQQRATERDEIGWGNWTSKALDGESGRAGGEEVTALAAPLVAVEQGSYWRNLTGFLKGEWHVREMEWEKLGLVEAWNETVRNPAWEVLKDANSTTGSQEAQSVAVTASVPEASSTGEEKEGSPAQEFITHTINITSYRGSHNWTAGGKLNFNIREVGRADLLNQSVIGPDPPPEDFYNLRGSLEVALPTTSFSYQLEGLHQLSTGSMIFVTSPDPRTILGFLPPVWDNATQTAAIETLKTGYDYRIQKLQRMIDSKQWPDDGDDDEDGENKCHWMGWGRIRGFGRPVPERIVELEEKERHEPSGLRLPQLNEPVMDWMMYSKECGMVIQSTEKGVKSLTFDSFWSKGLHYAVVFGVVSFIQTLLLVRQMEQRSSPANMAKISHLTILVQAVIDAYSLAMHLTLSVVTDNRSTIAFLIPSFFSGVGSMVFGLRYAAHIRILSSPAPTNAPPTPPPPTVAPPPSISAGGLPTPVTQSRTDNDDDAITLKDVGKFLIILAPILSIVAFITLWGFVPFFAMLMYSFWIPQIIHNCQYGQRRMGLKREFIFGTTLCRLFLPLYFWGCPDNILFIDSSNSVFLLVLYQGAQLAILLLQDSFHPRFFLPSWWREESYDYHPIMLADAEKGTSKVSHECGVCFENVDLRPTERKGYMCTPCRHIFHTKCLTTWMGIRMTCPMCKSTLPNYYSFIDS
ncbi:hypothetical protein BT69DRAFT_1249235 [Atractiella rhizophila]|nr:hypothetical protein BT69DRAFT_1249235 [Atractiella rhizophila]